MTNVSGIGNVFASLAGLSGAAAHPAVSTGVPSGISGAHGAPGGAHGGANPAARSPLDLLSRVQNRFSSSISSVLADAANGAYDDPEIAARSAALRTSLAEIMKRGATQAATGAGTVGAQAVIDVLCNALLQSKVLS